MQDFLSLAGIKGRFEENGFRMSTAKKSVRFFATEERVTVEQVQKSLQVSCVNQDWAAKTQRRK